MAVQSKIVAMLVQESGVDATMLVRRASGQFDLTRIDARLAAAARAAAQWDRSASGAYSKKPS